MLSFGEESEFIDLSIPALPSQFDYAADAGSLMLEQFRLKPKFRTWFDIHSAFATELESQALTIMDQRGLEAALGIQLDALGALLGIERHGYSDSDYRIFLRARCAVIASGSHVESIAAVLQIFADGFGLSGLYLRQEAQTVVLHCSVPSWGQILGALFAEQLAACAEAGTKLILLFEPPEALFTFVEA